MMATRACSAPSLDFPGACIARAISASRFTGCGRHDAGAGPVQRIGDLAEATARRAESGRAARTQPGGGGVLRPQRPTGRPDTAEAAWAIGAVSVRVRARRD